MKKIYIPFCFLLFTLFAWSQRINVFDVARGGTLAEIKSIYDENIRIIDTVDENKSSPLILACYKGNIDVALFLAEKVENINYNCGRGNALMAAVMYGNVSIIEKLIVKKADLNQTDLGGKTALMYAVFFNKNEIAKLLIKAGANVKLKDNEGKSALDFAHFNKNTELIILLD